MRGSWRHDKGEANKVRKIIGKKKDAKEFNQFKKKFVAGATKHIGSTYAEMMWNDFEKHSGYSFNKSHAVAYSMLSYWTAWLKTYYPLEFMYATLRMRRTMTLAQSTCLSAVVWASP